MMTAVTVGTLSPSTWVELMMSCQELAEGVWKWALVFDAFGSLFGPCFLI